MEKARQIPKIERGISKIIVPHEQGELIFTYPAVGPDTYQEVGRKILSRGQEVPTGDYTASLVHAAYCIPEVENEPEFQNIRNIMKRNWLCIFNRNLWTSEGVYVVQDLGAIGKSQLLDEKDLEKRLSNSPAGSPVCYSSDIRIRFAPKGSYKLGEHTPESLAKDSFMIASYGFEGAEKLGEIYSKFRYKPEIGGIDVQKGDNPKLTVSVLYDYVNSGLVIDGYYWGDYNKGNAFGVENK